MKLLIKLFLFSFLSLSILTFILMNYGGNVDFFYGKFTTPKVQSMIIGDSRSFQGIQPSVINTYFKSKKINLPMYNYSFTGAQAISGPLYNESILKKLDTTATNGLFIISITPDFLTEKEGFNNNLGEFREFDQPPHNMIFTDVNPNYEYVIKNLSFFHFKAVFKKTSTLHKDGWLEESNLPKDTLVFAAWKKYQMEVFLEDRDKYKISNVRVTSLNILISKLNHYGSVYLVRMPISKAYLNLENTHYPQLNKTIDSLAKINNIPYFNFNKSSKTTYKTYDGHHLDKYGGKEFTRILCDSISIALQN